MPKGLFASFLALVATFSINIPADAAKQPKLLPGYAAKENIEQVNKSIKWHESLVQAQAVAGSQGKMILWIQMVGKMDGAT
ncbi:MAG: hypothetical protein K8F91_01785 [Candidatus Obscuribacterales bacterium]|nr:hypothetical protein [Candidatus Obscuribacterales bacterium]